jgi:4-hydroxy-tetrahydrodipicolinate reductase
MADSIRVIQYGLGAIGRAAAKLVLERDSLQLVAAVDCNPELVGQDLGHILGLNKDLGISVVEKLEDLFQQVEADIVIHCTGSHFLNVQPELVAIAQAGLHCVTSCEEALFPHYRNPDLADDLNNQCVANSVSILGTGVNPGFVMDTLPAVLTAVSQRVDSIRILRIVNAATRREALQRKVGATMIEADFRKLVDEGRMGHIGLLESLVLLATSLNWNVENISEVVEPVIAPGSVRTDYLNVLRGQVAGVRQVATAERNGREALRLELQMYVGAENPRDEIEITGVPPMKLVIPGGTPGDLATPAILVNMIPAVVHAVPGLHTMATLQLPHITA